MFLSLRKATLVLIFATILCFFAGCAGKNGEMGLDPKKKTMKVKIDRTGGPVSEKIQRECVKEVSDKRIARGGGPLEALEPGVNTGDAVADATGKLSLAAMLAVTPLTGLLAIPALLHQDEQKADLEWVQQEMGLCSNTKSQAEMEKKLLEDMGKMQHLQQPPSKKLKKTEASRQ